MALKKKMLVIPPGISSFESPLLGVPALVAYLRKKGYKDVVQRDLNIGMFEYYCTKEGLLKAYNRNIEKISRLKLKEKSILWWFYAVLFIGCLWFYLKLAQKRVVCAIRELRSMHFDETPSMDHMTRLHKKIFMVPKIISQGYYVHPFQSVKFSNKFYSKDLISFLGKKVFRDIPEFAPDKELNENILADRHLNPFFDYNQVCVLPMIEKLDIDFLGISVSFHQQMVPALALAYAVKQKFPYIHISMGGTNITDLFVYSQLSEHHFRYVDSMVPYEGERTLYDLLIALENGTDLSKVPNLITFSDGKIIRRDEIVEENMDALPTSVFDGLNLNAYLCRPMRLPLMASRGCYWGKCTFCDHFMTLGTSPFRMRSGEKVYEDIVHIIDQTGITAFMFTDEAFPIKTIKYLVEKLSHPGTIRIKWIAQQRFEKSLKYDLLKKMKESGCVALLLGLESANERVLEVIKKGIKLSDVKYILQYCKELGIKTHIFTMIGIPTETLEEAKETVDFLLNNSSLYTTFDLGKFSLVAGSPMARDPEKFSITRKSSMDNGYFLDFEAPGTLADHEINTLKKKVKKGHMFYKSLHGSGIYQLDKLFLY